MTTIETASFRNIKFTRDTVVDYQTGNPLINCIFKQFDTNGDAKFDDEEWANYQKYEEKVKEHREKIEKFKLENNNIISHYQKKLAKIQAKQKKLYKKLESLTNPDYFEELIKFAKNHPSVSIEGYTDAKEIPNGAMKYDISAFGMGIYNKEQECFEGTYKTGYIAGLETLTEEEKKEYLSLIDKAANMIREVQKLDKEFEKFDKEAEKFLAIVDMAENGMIEKIGSSEYEEKAYQKYVEIRSNKNPFYKEIQEIETKRNALHLKGNKTEEEKKLLESYDRHLSQLYIASSQWSVSDNYDIEKFEIKTGTNYQLTHTMPDEKSIKNGEGINFSIGAIGSYQDENFDVQTSINVTREFQTTKLLDNQYKMAVSGKFDHGGAIYTTNLNCDITHDNRNYDVSLEYENGAFSASLQDIESYTREEEKFNHIRTINLNAGCNWNKYNVSAGLTNSGNRTTVSLNASVDEIATPIGSFTPAVTNQYNTLTKRFTTSPSLSFSKKHESGDLSAGIQVNENYTLTYGHGKPEHENNVNIVTSIGYKSLQGQLQYNNMYSGYSKSNTYGASVQYSTKKAGTFGAEYSFSRTHNSGNIDRTKTFSFTYSAAIDTIKKWLGIK